MSLGNLANRIIKVVRQAGATDESKTNRQGFLSWKAETHALFASTALTFTILTLGRVSVLGALVFITLYINRGDTIRSKDVVNDILIERAYTYGGVVAGTVLALLYLGVEP
jgi:hypothetical protein